MTNLDMLSWDKIRIQEYLLWNLIGKAQLLSDIQVYIFINKIQIDIFCLIWIYYATLKIFVLNYLSLLLLLLLVYLKYTHSKRMHSAFLISICFVFVVLGIKCRAVCMLGKCCVLSYPHSPMTPMTILYDAL
jgi:hypothetical protein